MILSQDVITASEEPRFTNASERETFLQTLKNYCQFQMQHQQQLLDGISDLVSERGVYLLDYERYDRSYKGNPNSKYPYESSSIAAFFPSYSSVKGTHTIFKFLTGYLDKLIQNPNASLLPFIEECYVSYSFDSSSLINYIKKFSDGDIGGDFFEASDKIMGLFPKYFAVTYSDERKNLKFMKGDMDVSYEAGQHTPFINFEKAVEFQDEIYALIKKYPSLNEPKDFASKLLLNTVNDMVTSSTLMRNILEHPIISGWKDLKKHLFDKIRAPIYKSKSLVDANFYVSKIIGAIHSSEAVLGYRLLKRRYTDFSFRDLMNSVDAAVAKLDLATFPIRQHLQIPILDIETSSSRKQRAQRKNGSQATKGKMPQSPRGKNTARGKANAKKVTRGQEAALKSDYEPQLEKKNDVENEADTTSITIMPPGNLDTEATSAANLEAAIPISKLLPLTIAAPSQEPTQIEDLVGVTRENEYPLLNADEAEITEEELLAELQMYEEERKKYAMKNAADKKSAFSKQEKHRENEEKKYQKSKNKKEAFDVSEEFALAVQRRTLEILDTLSPRLQVTAMKILHGRGTISFESVVRLLQALGAVYLGHMRGSIRIFKMPDGTRIRADDTHGKEMGDWDKAKIRRILKVYFYLDLTAE